MRSMRVSAVATCATALGVALLSACASTRLASEPPPGERLAGDWKLDVARGDDLGRAVEQLRALVAKAHHGRGGAQPQGVGGYPEEGPVGGAPGSGQAFSTGPIPRVSPVEELMSDVPEGDYLRIVVTPSSFTVTSGESSNQYTPGLESEISAEHGDAQQISGWKGSAYVIDTTPQLGPEITQSFDLTKDGRLTVTLRLDGNGIRFTFTRVYDRTTHVAPLAPPTTN